MSQNLSFGDVHRGVEPRAAAREAGAEPPFRILVLGDFSGRESRGICEPHTIVERRPLMADRDNLQQVMQALEVELADTLIVGQQQAVSLRFRELDDFHPDRLYCDVPLFEELRGTRRDLFNQASFARAAAKVRRWAAHTEPAASATPAPASARPLVENDADLLDLMLDQPEPQQRATASRGQWQLDSLLRELVEPYMSEAEDPQQGELVACVDEAIGKTMQYLLHHPRFQQLESAWRGLDLLTRRLETGTSLKIYVLDVSRQELAQDLSAHDDLARTGIYRLLVEQSVGTHGGEPWAVLASNYRFGPGREDAQLLGRMAKIAAAAQAPFVAAATGSLIGCRHPGRDSDPDHWTPLDGEQAVAWHELAALPEAAYVGLAWPRFLVRLPYGADTEPVETFAFEELSQPPAHHEYLWGNPGLLVALLLGQSFTESGWRLRPGQLRDVENLPIHVYRHNGSVEARPCGELLLHDRAAEWISDRRVMPLLSAKGQDTVRVRLFRSVASTELAGRWTA